MRKFRWQRTFVISVTVLLVGVVHSADSSHRRSTEGEQSHGNDPERSVVAPPPDDTHPTGWGEVIDATGTNAATKWRYLSKEGKKYRKKFVSDDDYRQSMPHEPPPQQQQQQQQQQQRDGDDGERTEEAGKPHSRKKRLIWVTDDGRLALPPGTSLTIAPTIALPFVRYPPTGFLSNISISLPVTIDFDKLGLTDNQNPLGVLPPLFARSMGQTAGTVLADYVSDYMHIRRKKRSLSTDHFRITNSIDDEQRLPELPVEHRHAFHGGERALLYAVVEDFIANFGLDGRACMLRAICEVHSKSIEKFGLLGEVLKLFFTASLSPFSQHLEEYVTAENVGKGRDGPGECFPYYKDCPKSLFRSSHAFQHNYRPEQQHQGESNDVDSNSIDDGDESDEFVISRDPRQSNTNTKEGPAIVQLVQPDLNRVAM